MPHEFRVNLPCDWYTEWDEEGNIVDEYPIETYGNIKIMLYKAADSSTYKFEKEPSGTVFEKFEEELFPFNLTKIVSCSYDGTKLDEIIIPLEVQSLDGFGDDYSQINFYEDRTEFYCETYGATDITKYLPRNTIKVIEGGTINFVNEHNLTNMESLITYVIRKGGY